MISVKYVSVNNWLKIHKNQKSSFCQFMIIAASKIILDPKTWNYWEHLWVKTAWCPPFLQLLNMVWREEAHTCMTEIKVISGNTPTCFLMRNILNRYLMYLKMQVSFQLFQNQSWMNRNKQLTMPHSIDHCLSFWHLQQRLRTVFLRSQVKSFKVNLTKKYTLT